MASETFEGGCSCGRARYRLTSLPMVTQACHCRFCRRETSAPYAVKAFIEKTCVEILSGEFQEVTIFPEGDYSHRVVSCVDCLTHLWSIYPGMDGGIGEKVMMIWTGTLDEPERLPPQAHIFVEQKLPWVEISESQKAFEGYYPDNSLVWSETALVRRSALSD